MYTENQISQIVLNCCIKIHKALGPGLLESVYVDCLAYELQKAGLFVEKEVAMPVVYEGLKMENSYRLDLLIEKKVIIEAKSVDELHPVHKAQILTYLKLSGCWLGLLINFNVPRMIDGFNRYVN